ncbi:hypothetical protein C8R44DRAFT_883074 [Mycena epipterygia]|nr:hypothetical protein C8R44DRAFT_883074 [Mycena epipterygia]
MASTQPRTENAQESQRLDHDTSMALPSLSAQQQQAQLAALLRFKPSSRDVIGGIAPHVFDDSSPFPRRPRRRTSNPHSNRRRSSSPAPRRSRSGLSAVISVDEHAPKREENIVLEVYTAPVRPAGAVPLARLPKAKPLPVSSKSKSLPASSVEDNSDAKSKRHSFRINRVFKTLVFRLK